VPTTDMQAASGDGKRTSKWGRLAAVKLSKKHSLQSASNTETSDINEGCFRVSYEAHGGVWLNGDVVWLVRI